MALNSSVRARIGDRDPTQLTITGPGVTLQTPRAGDLSQFIDIRVPQGYTYVFPTGRPVVMYTMVHESRTSASTAGTQETFNLNNDLVNSPTVNDAPALSGAADLVAYEDGTYVTPDSVNYTNDTVTLTNSTANSTYDIYYLWGDSSEIQARTRSRDLEEYKQVFGSTARRMHSANLYSSEERQTFSEGFQLDAKERLRFLINTGVDLTNWDGINGNGPNGSSSHSFFQLPVYKLKSSPHTDRPGVHSGGRGPGGRGPPGRQR